MRYSTVLYLLGVLLTLFSLSMLVPALIAYFENQGYLQAFGLSFLLHFSVGVFLWLSFRSSLQREMGLNEGFMITVLFWVVLGVFAAFPFVVSPLGMSVTNALFESISGLTTTGATVITNLDDLPKSILFYRQQLQWFGGMGIIVLAVAVLPMLGVGGMQLYRAETPGPVKDNKLRPRITETAKLLWGVYLVMTVLCALSYWLAGMNFFEAVSHSFSTVALGGFSLYNESIGKFDSPLIESVAIIFMLLSVLNFSLYFIVWQKKDLRVFWRDPECRFFTIAMLIFILTVISSLILINEYNYLGAIRKGLFQTVSIVTTAGFGIDDFAAWHGPLPMIIMLGACMGGCVGSTGGGIKAIRVLLLLKQGYRELKRLAHPSGFFAVRLNKRVVPDKVLDSVSGFVIIYIVLLISLSIIIMFLGLDPKSAISAVISTLNNLGPGLGEVAHGFSSVSDEAKWLFCIAMLFGRLEIFTLLVLFTPAFWRR